LTPSYATSSAIYLAKKLCKFVFCDSEPLAGSVGYQDVVVGAIISMVEFYVRHMVDVAHDTSTTESQTFHVLLNLHFLSHTVLPFIRRVLENRVQLVETDFDDILPRNRAKPVTVGFSRSVSEFQRVIVRTESLIDIVIGILITKSVKLILSVHFPFGPACVSSPSLVQFNFGDTTYPVSEILTASKSIRSCVERLRAVDEAYKSFVVTYPDRAITTMIRPNQIASSALELFLRILDNDQNWQTVNKFGYTGLHQFVLDITYLALQLKEFVSPGTADLVTKVCSKAVTSYFASCSVEQRKLVLKDGSWFQGRAQK
jgi:hypothetical protein